MSWTTLDLNNLLAGEPLIEAEALALYENPIAIAEGAADAPRIRTLAMQPPSAGNNHIIMRLQESSESTSSSSYPDNRLHNRFSRGQHLGCTALVAGVIRCYLLHRKSSSASSSHSSHVRVVKNGSTVQSWSTTSGSFQTRTVDVSVDVGDAVMFQHRVSDSSSESEWRLLRVYSATPDMAVA